jgi:hypothetical protein
MSAKYLLPCECGQSIAIDSSQAGQQVSCACGKSQEAPTLRAMRNLPSVGEFRHETKPRPEPAPWSPLQGALFGAGALIALLSGCVAGYAYYVILENDVPAPRMESAEDVDRKFESYSIDEMYSAYLKAKEEGIGPYPSDYVLVKRGARFYHRIALGALVGVGLGLAVAGSSFFVKSRGGESARGASRT